MAKKFTIDDWQQRLNILKQPVVIVGKRKENKKDIFNILCYKCGNTFEVDRKALYEACKLRENGKYQINWCPICNRKRSVEGLNDVATLRSDLVKYFVNSDDAKKYSVGSHSRVRLKCLECGNEKTLEVCDLCLRGFHCDYCSDFISLGNKIIRNLVMQLPIHEYAFEFSDIWTQNKRYDCYFCYHGEQFLIEVDGLQHIRDTNWATKKQQKANDILKSELASKNGYSLIRIKAYKSDFDYIKKNIIESDLAEIFDLGNVDWNYIRKQTITSMNVEMARYYMTHKDLFLGDIAKHFHVTYPTLKKALTKLASVGMCDYNKKDAFKNSMQLKHRKILYMKGESHADKCKSIF